MPWDTNLFLLTWVHLIGCKILSFGKDSYAPFLRELFVSDKDPVVVFPNPGVNPRLHNPCVKVL